MTEPEFEYVGLGYMGMFDHYAKFGDLHASFQRTSYTVSHEENLSAIKGFIYRNRGKYDIIGEFHIPVVEGKEKKFLEEMLRAVWHQEQKRANQ